MFPEQQESPSRSIHLLSKPFEIDESESLVGGAHPLRGELPYFNSGYLANKLSIDQDTSLITHGFEQKHHPLSAVDVLLKYSRETLKWSLVNPDLITAFQLA